MQPYFITATGTDIGKTLLTTTLAWQLKQAGKKVRVCKPILTGYTEGDSKTDTALLLSSVGLPYEHPYIDEVSPWRFKAALSPNMAAAQENKTIALDDVVSFCRNQEEQEGEVLLVEGVGGILVPLNNRHTVLDWMKALGWPVMVATGTYLGALNHTLMTIRLLQAEGLSIKALVLFESDNSTVSVQQTADTLEQFMSQDIPIVKIPRLRQRDRAWEDMPSIGWVCES